MLRRMVAVAMMDRMNNSCGVFDRGGRGFVLMGARCGHDDVDLDCFLCRLE